MPASSTYTIYAAPRAAAGRYQLCKAKPLFTQTFSMQEAIQRFWEKTIVPATSTEFGLAFDASWSRAVMWDFIGDPR